MSNLQYYYAAAPKGVGDLLTAELSAIGAQNVRQQGTGVSFAGPIEIAYRACLWSRLASRILLRIAEFPAPTAEALYEGIQQTNWQDHLDVEGTMAVEFIGSGRHIRNSHFGALKVKDAIVDQYRAATGSRPSIDLQQPDVRIHARLDRDRVLVSLDLAGQSLHRRGYRSETGPAPLKENLASAILIRAGWPGVASAGGTLIDPMCGTGTLPIEAAWIAGDCAPGLLRDYFGFTGWLGHVPKLWSRLRDEALDRKAQGMAKLPEIVGCDMNPRAIQQAKGHAERAGLGQAVRFEQRAVSATIKPSGPAGLVVVNPPYGQRLGEIAELGGLYGELGQALKQNFRGWKAAVFTGNPQLGHALGMRALLDNKLYNGPIECRLLRFEVEEGYFTPDQVQTPVVAVKDAGAKAKIADRSSSGAQMLANRLRKNRRILGRWARRENIDCYRLYDADLPEYALAVDLYKGEELWVHVQEYQAPRSIDQDKARHRRDEALATIAAVLEISAEQIYLKVRHRQKGHAQYEKLDQGGAFREVAEGPCRLWVNFANYLDTGLFLDHRPTRELVATLARGRRFLNLFAYTGVATVRAAMEGAASTTSVDMSQTYLDWAQRNLELNGLRGHELVRADCLEWLGRKQGERYGVIFLDPPTFSNSKRMDRDFDVQRDHVELIERSVALLDDDGVLIFSNNYRRFIIDRHRLAGLDLEDITRQTIPTDFERRPKIHNCWKITRMP